MSRKKALVDHPQASTLEQWRALALRRSSLAGSTVRVYSSDISRFLNSLSGSPLDKVTTNTMAAFLAKLDRRSRSRMLSALSEFFAFAFEKGLMENDPLRSLKYRRSRAAAVAQLDFLPLLSKAGIASPEQLTWEDFVRPMVDREESKVQVNGRLVTLTPYVWNRLEVRFRNLASRHTLRQLLRRRIA
ncbi:MAG TPA: site-specific integrase [Candidatus Binatia bacterium]|nr:site-specific integrase [Candidatus Binatia bacterium]